jgi:U3 small nucleolar RNA-associated protein 15
MSHYVPLDIVKFPRKPIPEASQQKHWKHYKNTYLRQDSSAITNIAHSSMYYAITASSRVRFFNYDNQNKFSLSRFQNTAIGGTFRPDGELFSAGDIEGNVAVYQVSTKTVLRSYKHPKPSYGIVFADNTHLATGCDDYIVRYWDLTQKKEISRFEGHSDYVRAIETFNAMIASGGMDGKLKLWDLKSHEAIEFNHGSPISSIVVTDNYIVTSGHTEYKVWDFRNMNCVSNFSPHSKTITCMALDSTKTKLLTGSIDCALKVHCLNTSKVEFNLKYPNPILSVQLTHNDAHLIVGMADGKLSVRQKRSASIPPSYAEATDELYLKRWAEFYKSMPETTVKNYKYFNRGIYTRPEINELALDNDNRKKIKEYDLLLRKFRYGEVLDMGFESDRPEVTITIIHELVLRNGLQDALASREPDTIIKIILWLSRKIHNPKYTTTLLPLSSMVIDMYSAVSSLNSSVLEAIRTLSKEVDEEYAQQTLCLELIGIIDFLIPE